MSIEEPAASPSGGDQEGGAAPGTPNPWVSLTIVCLGQFMIVLDATVVNIAAPAIQQSLHFSGSSLQWIINAYTLVTGGFLLLGGRAGDLIGRRAVFQAGTLLFTAASLFSALAPSAGALVAGRGLQGLGAAFASPAALAVLLATFRNSRERTMAVTVWSIIALAGGAVGVLLGGLLTSYLSWRWIFYINVPIGALTVLFSLRYVAESRGTGLRRRFDLPGAVTVTAGTMLLAYAIVQAPTWGWGSAKTIGFGLAALALLAVFVVIELRGTDPLVQMNIFRIRALSVGNVALMLVGGSTFALFLFASLYVQDILHYSALRSGLAFLPVFAGSVIGAVGAQQLMSRIGIRAVSVAGLVISAVGMVLLAGVPANGSYAVNLLGQLVLISIGLGMATVPLTQMATSGLPEELSGLASGVNNAAQNIGRSLGLAILTSVVVSYTAHSLRGTSPAAVVSAEVSGYHAGFIGSAILLVAGVVLTIALVRPKDTAAIDDEARSGKPKPSESGDVLAARD